MKAVLDTNVFVSSIFWDKGLSHRIVKAALDRKISIFTSIEILQELEKVLHRDFQEPEYIIQRQIALICEYADVVISNVKLDVVKDDPEDNKILECAKSCGAEYIVTGDKHLLNIKEYSGVRIINPRGFVKILDERSSV